MANLPRNAYSLNGGLAFAGAPAHGNTNARELQEGPASGQVSQSLQQEGSRQAVLAELAAVNQAQRYKLALQAMIAPQLSGMQKVAQMGDPEAIASAIGMARSPLD